MNNYLFHDGIKGMRWGVRRYQNPDGTLTEAGRERYLKKMHKKATRLGWLFHLFRNLKIFLNDVPFGLP